MQKIKMPTPPPKCRRLRFCVSALYFPGPQNRVVLEEQNIRAWRTHSTHVLFDLSMFLLSPGNRSANTSMRNAQWALPEFSGFTAEDK